MVKQYSENGTKLNGVLTCINGNEANAEEGVNEAK